MHISATVSVLLLLGFILHHVSHPAYEDASNSDGFVHADQTHMQPTFSPSFWLYFVPSQIASHLPLSFFFSAFVESSAAIALTCMLVIGTVGHRLERQSNNDVSVGSFCALFAISHVVFLVMSFLVAVLTSALLPSHNNSDATARTRIGQAFFGPLALATAVAVVGWCRDPNVAIVPSLSGASPPSPLSSNASSSSSDSQPQALIATIERRLTLSRFVPFHLLSVALIHDLFFADLPPTQSEMLLGLATRGPLFPGVLAAFVSTWSYLRYVEQQQSEATSSSAGGKKEEQRRRGNADATFALHMCCPVDAVTDGVLLPASTFLSTSGIQKVMCCLLVSSSTLERIDARWAEQKASLLFLDTTEKNNSNINNDSVVVNVAPNSPLLPPLPGTTDAEADRRRELAMAALQRRLDHSLAKQQPQPRPLTPPTVGSGEVVNPDLSGSLRELNLEAYG